jgi:hypothetical protein
MPLCIYLIFITLAMIVLYCVRLFVLYQTYIHAALLLGVLKEENSGRYQEALIIYQSALNKLIKINDFGTMKNRIVDSKEVNADVN